MIKWAITKPSLEIKSEHHKNHGQPTEMINGHQPINSAYSSYESMTLISNKIKVCGHFLFLG